MHDGNYQNVLCIALVHETEWKPTEQSTLDLAPGEQSAGIRIGHYLAESTLNLPDEVRAQTGRTCFRKIWPPQSTLVRPTDERQQSPKRNARFFKHLVCGYAFDVTAHELGGAPILLCTPCTLGFRIGNFFQAGNQPFSQACP
jgi:hypothetical protein